ncbi:MAG TPA: hypothetical protein PKB02_06045 [Anaerohalosphaeraceae bacterium]|nr:hypothetical protein [Anaerohalosphaeraceae bacterium]
MKIVNIMVAMLSLCIPGIAAKTEDIKTVLQKTFEMEMEISETIKEEKMVEQFGMNVLPYAVDYLTDPNNNKKYYGKKMLFFLSQQKKDVAEKKEIVEAILGKTLDNKQLRDEIYRGFPTLWQQDAYSDTIKQKLHELLIKQDEEIIPIILHVGCAGMTSELGLLKTIAEQEVYPVEPDSWPCYGNAFTALMARARMGEKEDIIKCIDLVKGFSCEHYCKYIDRSDHKTAGILSKKVEDYRVQYLLREISYIRQPEVVEYIKSYIYSDQVTRNLGPDTVSQSYADIAAEYLRQMIKDFPSIPYQEYKRYCTLGTSEERIQKKTIESRHKYFAEFYRSWFEQQKELEIIR